MPECLGNPCRRRILEDLRLIINRYLSTGTLLAMYEGSPYPVLTGDFLVIIQITTQVLSQAQQRFAQHKTTDPSIKLNDLETDPEHGRRSPFATVYQDIETESSRFSSVANGSSKETLSRGVTLI